MHQKQWYGRQAINVLLCAVGIVHQETRAGKFVVCDRRVGIKSGLDGEGLYTRSVSRSDDSDRVCASETLPKNDEALRIDVFERTYVIQGTIRIFEDPLRFGTSL